MQIKKEVPATAKRQQNDMEFLPYLNPFKNNWTVRPGEAKNNIFSFYPSRMAKNIPKWLGKNVWFFVIFFFFSSCLLHVIIPLQRWPWPGSGGVNLVSTGQTDNFVVNNDIAVLLILIVVVIILIKGIFIFIGKLVVVILKLKVVVVLSRAGILSQGSSNVLGRSLYWYLLKEEEDTDTKKSYNSLT